LEQPIKQLFLKYIKEQASPEEISQVLSLIQSGGYEQEWEVALAEFQADFQLGRDENSPLDERLLYQKIKARTHLRSGGRSFSWLGYAASFLLICTIAYFALRPATRPVTFAQNEPAKPVAQKISGHKWIKLEDGTSVQLNTGSRLEYTQSFKGKKKREVTLFGEAFFDVVHDPVHPFVIHTGELTTTVLGTAFNISAYAGQKAITVTVTRGKVMVQKKGETLAVLTPNEQLSWQSGQVSPLKHAVNAEQTISWKSGDLIMDDLTLAQAAELIAKRYGVEVSFKNEKVKKCRFTAAFLDRNEIGQVTEVLADITGASFQLKAGKLLIDGPGCEN
jgi:ferric-dicitrate binding protein FerR (iron transport regulator)